MVASPKTILHTPRDLGSLGALSPEILVECMYTPLVHRSISTGIRGLRLDSPEV